LAVQLLDESLALVRATGIESSARVADTEFVKAQVLYEQGQHQQAMSLIEPRLPALRAAPTPRAPEFFALAAELGVYLGETDKSLAYARECAALGPRVFAPDTTDALTAQLVPGMMLGHANRLQESIDSLEPVLARWRALGLTRTREYADALSTLAGSKHSLGDVESAERYTREALEVDRAILQAPHDALADDLNNLGALLSSVRRFDEAEAPLQEALAMRRALFGDEHVDVVRSLNTLASNRNGQRRLDEAIGLLEQARGICTRLAARNEYCAQTYSQLGSTLTSLGRYQEALGNNTLANEWRLAINGERSQAYATALSGRAATHINLGHLDEGERDCRQALTIFGEIGMGESLQGATARQWCARARLDRGDFAGALADAHQAAELWQAQGMARQPTRLIDLRSIEVRALRGLERHDEARELARATLTVAKDIEHVPAKTLELLRATAGDDTP
jgi:tetratricopeptide (TPR) repeat protein